MHAMFKLAIVSLCLAVASAGQLPHAAEINLMQFFMQSRDISQQNPVRSMACFDYYLPVLNDIGLEYERSYGACQDEAKASQAQVDENTQPERESLQDSAESSCKLLSDCVQMKDSVSYFECFESAGAANTKTMYAISANASDVLSEVREQYRLIQNVEYRCTNASERAYLEDSANAYDQMNSCLQGKTPVPTTTAAPPTEEPTEAPTQEPTEQPTEQPTEEPTEQPTAEPIQTTTDEPEVEVTTDDAGETAGNVPGVMQHIISKFSNKV